MASVWCLAACLISLAWVRSASVFPSDLYDLYEDKTKAESLLESLQEDNEHGNKNAVFQPPYEVIEPKQLSSSMTKDSESLLYLIKIARKTLTLFVRKQIFVPEDFEAFVDGTINAQLTKSILSMSNCYYSGQVLDLDESSVTLTTCFGLRGMIEFLNESYIIEPFPLASPFHHLVYKLDTKPGESTFSLENDTDLKSRGYQHKLLKQFHHATKIKTSIFAIRRYIKASVYVTMEVYKALGSSPTNVITYFMQVFSYLNSKFESLNMQIFLSAVDIWTVSNPCSVSKALSVTLENFIVWLSELSFLLRSYDMPLLIVSGYGPEIGTTYFGQMCSHHNGAVLTFPTGLLAKKYSSLVAHILGHNLGMVHYDSSSRECVCPVSTCIMDANIMTASNTMSFSSCSLEDFQTFLLSGRAKCLFKNPNMKSLMDPSLCGNRVLDIGESCDCGTEADCINDPCCDFKTCTLKSGAMCAYGACCLNCQFIAAATPCRKAADECDLPEFCTGAMAVCPEDVHQQNGNPCNVQLGACYKGKCQNADTQCKQVFGPDSVSAHLECYRERNVIGDRFGNCEGIKGFYARCHSDDVLCGKLQCVVRDGENVSIENAVVSYYSTEHQTCVTADYLTNTELTDLLWVNDGTMCGEKKMCINQMCRNISRSAQTCERETTCAGHGICNNKHKCHCDHGWKPPVCDTPADVGTIFGGAVADKIHNSGDTHAYEMNVYFTKWLLILFFVILPFFIILLFAFKFLLPKFCQLFKKEEDSSEESSDESKSMKSEAVTEF